MNLRDLAHLDFLISIIYFLPFLPSYIPLRVFIKKKKSVFEIKNVLTF